MTCAPAIITTATTAVCAVSPVTASSSSRHRRSSTVPTESPTIPASGSRYAQAGAVPRPRSDETTSATPTTPEGQPDPLAAAGRPAQQHVFEDD